MSTFWQDFEADAAAEAPQTQAEIDQYYASVDACLAVEREAEKRLTRKERIAHCGEAYGLYVNAEKGTFTHGVYHCGVWRGRECPLCFEYRMVGMRGAAHRAVLDARKDDKKLKYVQADKSTIDKITRGVDKSKYARFPGEDFDILLIVEDECVREGKIVSYDDISDLDWATIADTPKKRRASGSLGKPSAAPGSKTTVAKIKVTSYVLHNDTTKEQERAGLEAAMKATAHLKPTTLAEVQVAVKKRQTAFVREVVKAGGKFLAGAARTIHVKCDLASIEWKDYTDKSAEVELAAMIEEDAIPF